MPRLLHRLTLPALAALLLAFASADRSLAQADSPTAPEQTPPSQTAPAAPAPTQSAENTEKPAADSGVGRGKRLVLKDGSFQVIREYQRLGDRVRYYSLERADWEELPASLIDWDAT